MALSTRSDLITAVLALVERQDADTTAYIPDAITLCEADMNRRLKARARYSRSTATLSTEFSAVPADFAGARSFKIDGGNRLKLISEQEMADLKNSGTEITGEPEFFCVVGSEFEFHPIPDSDYDAVLTYRQKVPALTVSNTTNWTLTAHPDAYYYGTGMHVAIFLEDGAKAQAYKALYEAAVAQIEADDELQTFAPRPALRRTPFASC